MSNNGNQYFETMNRFEGEMTEDVLINRMEQCNAVLSELANSHVWKIVLDDARTMIKTLDDNWQNMIPNDAKFSEARVIKMTCKHIVDLPGKYLQELTQIQEELSKRQHPDEIISKDSDNEN